MFLLGTWKNYDDLEEQLSIEELTATLNAHRKIKKEEHRFLAAIQGVSLPDEDIVNDIADLKGFTAAQEGFGVGFGVGHATMEVVSS